jgi:hypothetical protein
VKTLKLISCQSFNKDVNYIVTSIKPNYGVSVPVNSYRRDVVTSIKPNYGVSVPVDNNRRDGNRCE